MHPNLYALGAILCWASLPAATGTGLDGLNTTELLFYSFVPAAAYLVIQDMVLRRSFSIPVPSFRMSLLGLIGIFGYHWVYYMALEQAPIVEGAILASTWSFWIVIFSSVLHRRSLSISVTGLAALGMYGAYLVIAGDANTDFNLSYMTGYTLALCCGLIWSSFSVALSHWKPKYDYMPVFTLYAAIVSTGMYGWSLATSAFVIPSASSIVSAVYLGLVPLGLSFTLWNRAVTSGNMTVIGYLSYLTPPLAVLLAFIVRQAPVPFTSLLGLGCILFASIMGRRLAS